ncbi:hypothetical protein M514_07358 [Trichuris suis]|uniref:Uncharacterized protein n=1 Tax=Trichuris suis TaxID=68888 RepID=A0A085M3N5_9BILA|nr:hypothetical protein M513_07358 [Trichuris suis]KFD68374.1 hypothetical protein M514_07358 [Trichuris suis]KHJ47723.1 hypothetical protein D918_01880 [Trichuris suis]
MDGPCSSNPSDQSEIAENSHTDTVTYAKIDAMLDSVFTLFDKVTIFFKIVEQMSSEKRLGHYHRLLTTAAEMELDCVWMLSVEDKGKKAQVIKTLKLLRQLKAKMAAYEIYL